MKNWKYLVIGFAFLVSLLWLFEVIDWSFFQNKKNQSSQWLAGFSGSKNQVLVAYESLAGFENKYQTAKDQDEVIILDLRRRSEWEGGHIPFSISFSPESLSFAHIQKKIDRYEEVLVVAGETELIDGFLDHFKRIKWKRTKRVMVLQKPVADWQSAGYPWRGFYEDQ
ncbi:MAG: rhodanese-like domain-containing protein [Candidatus Pacebacteria bacterium]|nr:rhodanese-like domain-containing protein [Candidatus Paceibacterota bacterium]